LAPRESAREAGYLSEPAERHRRYISERQQEAEKRELSFAVADARSAAATLEITRRPLTAPFCDGRNSGRVD